MIPVVADQGTKGTGLAGKQTVQGSQCHKDFLTSNTPMIYSNLFSQIWLLLIPLLTAYLTPPRADSAP